jgi:hypothetical protein
MSVFRTILAAGLAVAALSVAGTALADEPRWNNEDFVRAAGCATYATLPALQGDGVDVSAIVARVNAEMPRKDRDIQKRAAREVRTALMAAHQGADVAELRERRARACARFLTTPQTAALQ